MAAAPNKLPGPLQQGRGVHGPYSYWACHAQPSDGSPHGLLGLVDVPTRRAFCEFAVKAHSDVWKEATQVAINNKRKNSTQKAPVVSHL